MVYKLVQAIAVEWGDHSLIDLLFFILIAQMFINQSKRTQFPISGRSYVDLLLARHQLLDVSKDIQRP